MGAKCSFVLRFLFKEGIQIALSVPDFGLSPNELSDAVNRNKI
jgi:hypothetical protein